MVKRKTEKPRRGKHLCADARYREIGVHWRQSERAAGYPSCGWSSHERRDQATRVGEQVSADNGMVRTDSDGHFASLS